MTAITFVAVELEDRTYTIDLNASAYGLALEYQVRGKRGAAGRLIVWPDGTMKIVGIERLARRGRKLAHALEGVVPGVKTPQTVNAQRTQQALVQRRKPAHSRSQPATAPASSIISKRGHLALVHSA